MKQYQLNEIQKDEHFFSMKTSENSQEQKIFYSQSKCEQAAKQFVLFRKNLC